MFKQVKIYQKKFLRKLKYFLFKLGFHPRFININGNYYPLNSKCYCSEVLYLEKNYEPALFLLIKKYLKKNDYFFDIGLSLGYFSIFSNSILKNTGKIFGFDILKIHEKNYKLTLFKNKITNFTFHNIALGSDSYKNTSIDNNNLDQSHVLHTQSLNNNEKQYISKNKNFSTIKSISFDNFIIENKINQVDFLKIDIDGSEYIFLINALNTIRTFKPFIIFEWKFSRFKRHKKEFEHFFFEISTLYNIYIIINENLDLKNSTKINNLSNLPEYNCSLFFESKEKLL